MEWIIIGLFIFMIIAVLILKGDWQHEKEAILKAQKHISQQNELTESQRYYIGDKCIGLSTRKGYNKFSIAGAYYRDLPITMVGKFNGYAIAQTDNEHDQYAIAIYNDTGVHLGFLPGGNKKQHSYIINEGEQKQVHAYGYLAWHGSGMYGEVCVETDKSLVARRNKPYVVN
ncbi:hypothetical protein QHG78_01985 [Bacteroides sp. A1-P5]|uniref:HIRAN domain-containing protein n=1 Tax=Bacteroides vicugnae TaxID=3037989 RepID=A0ABU5HNM2_9BACE|nr:MULTISPECIES: hypothetical protein [unclassified Bacteroides]MDY7252035.1 hypothetical protein [Bacteroides sp. A1-P5]MDY7256490.1 hypothetical protein [Bacteroides sp. A2-P53]